MTYLPHETTSADPESVSNADTSGVPLGVSVEEPLLRARVHRPTDLIRALCGLLGVGSVLLLASFARKTANGIESDLTHGILQVPEQVVWIAGFFSTAAVLIVPIAFAVERLLKHDSLRVAYGVLAAVVAHLTSLGVDVWVAHGAPDAITAALTQTTPSGGGLTDPVHGYLAPVMAFMTAMGLARRPRWRVALTTVIVLDALAVLVGGYTTPLSIALTILIGWTVAYVIVYAIGSPSVRLTGRDLLRTLRDVGFTPTAAYHAPSRANEPHRYLVRQLDGTQLDVTVIDRETQASGFFYRSWRRFWLRTTIRRNPLSLRRVLEQEALLAYAVSSAGARTPRLIATAELGPDAVILVYEHVTGRTLRMWEDDQITDALLREIWRQLQLLQARGIAHRNLVADALNIDSERKVELVRLGDGQIAAGDLLLRMDIAELLTTVALRVGPERAVASAESVLGAERVGAALPLLQPVGLSRATRAELKQHNEAVKRADAERELTYHREVREYRHSDSDEVEEAVEPRAPERTGDLLSQIREQILRIQPKAPIEPTRLARLRLRTVITVVGGTAAAYFLLSQFSTNKNNSINELARANWAWVLVALLAAASSYFAAALGLLGFIPEKINWGRTVIAQLAASFVKLVAPGVVGGVAVNTRYLQRAGIPPGQAVSSVGASQLIGLGLHILQLLLFGYLAGTKSTPSLAPSHTVIAGLLVVAVLVLVVSAISPVRRWLLARLQPLVGGVIPRMLDVLQQPLKLTLGICGQLLVSLTFVASLYACLLAFDQHPSFAVVAAVFLAGNALGSAFPTPGGLGAIEVALSTGLTTAASMPYDTALSAVLLFRLLTFWLPVLPGWLAFAWLQRRRAL